MTDAKGKKKCPRCKGAGGWTLIFMGHNQDVDCPDCNGTGVEGGQSKQEAAGSQSRSSRDP